MEATLLDPAQDLRADVKKAFGFVPNLFNDLTEASPAVARFYLSGNQILRDVSLTPQEQQTVILTISAFNDCHYCTAAHTKAGQAAGLPQEEIDALLEGGLPSDARLRSLARTTLRLLSKRGWLSEDDFSEFAAESVDRTEITEILGFIALKTLSNFFNHFNQTEIDPQFQ